VSISSRERLEARVVKPRLPGGKAKFIGLKRPGSAIQKQKQRAQSPNIKVGRFKVEKH
jgi:hypothetical protein